MTDPLIVTARRTLELVAAEHVTREARVVALALWAYRGGPWEALSTHGFEDP